MVRASGRYFSAIFLVACATLALEITLSRFFSVVTWYHLAFFAISLAMLGMTSGAVEVYLRPDRFTPERRDAAFATAATRFALGALLALLLLCVVPVELKRSAWTPFCFVAVTLGCALPFHQAGVIVSALLTRPDLPVSRLYAFDLFGAALGCLLVLAALPFVDAPGLFLLCAALGLLARGLFDGRTGRAGLLAAALAGVALGHSHLPFKLAPRYVKGYRDDAGAHVLDRWNSISRVTVYQGGLMRPQLWGPSPLAPTGFVNSVYMSIDGEAATVVRQFLEKADIEHLRYDVTNVGHLIAPTGRSVCVIGVGGGRDLQSALLFDARKVTGVEVNPIFLDLLRGPFRDFAGLAPRNNVSLNLADARSWLSTAGERFDFIQMSLIDTWAATGAGAFSLTENSLYTVEAWITFLNRLSDDGMFSVSRWHKRGDLGETGRLVSLGVASLLAGGTAKPADHLALITTDRCCTLLVSRRPFTAEQRAHLREACAAMKYQLAFQPGEPPEHAILRDLLASATLAELRTAAAPADLNYDPPTDENPYFFNMLRLSNMGRALQETHSIARGNLTATLTLMGLLLALLIVTVATVVLPLWWRRRHGAALSHPAFRVGAVYFSLLGAGFMLGEIALMQRLSVMLGHPVLAMGVLLFTLIASTGAGSWLNERVTGDACRWRRLAPAAAAAAFALLIVVLPRLSAICISAPLATRIAVSIALLTPLGLLLGGFFPTGMKLARRAGLADTPWFWALNGVFGVLCSALAVLIGIYAGISVNLALAAGCYALTLPCLAALARAGNANAAPT